MNPNTSGQNIVKNRCIHFVCVANISVEESNLCELFDLNEKSLVSSTTRDQGFENYRGTGRNRW